MPALKGERHGVYSGFLEDTYLADFEKRHGQRLHVFHSLFLIQGGKHETKTVSLHTAGCAVVDGYALGPKPAFQQCCKLSGP